MKKFSKHLFLILIALISLFPFIWLVSTSLKGAGENIYAYPPKIIPEELSFENFAKVWERVPFISYFVNSLVVATFTVILNLFFSAAAGYPLARMDFKGKNFIFYLILSSMMIPFQTIMLPIYVIILKLNLVDTAGMINGYAGLILPFCVNAFGIFFMRQAFKSVPKELEEAAAADGCGIFGIWFSVLLPSVSPALALLAVLTFIGSWSEFLWPSIVLTSRNFYTLPVGLNDLQGLFGSNFRLIAAGSVICTIPAIIFFICMQKFFVSGHNSGAIKG